jgi:hypothetical protein
MLDSADIHHFARKRQAAMDRRSCSASHFKMAALGASWSRKKCRKQRAPYAVALPACSNVPRRPEGVDAVPRRQSSLSLQTTSRLSPYLGAGSREEGPSADAAAARSAIGARRNEPAEKRLRLAKSKSPKKRVRRRIVSPVWVVPLADDVTAREPCSRWRRSGLRYGRPARLRCPARSCRGCRSRSCAFRCRPWSPAKHPPSSR